MPFKIIDRTLGVEAINRQIREAEEDIQSLHRHIQKLKDLLREKREAVVVKAVDPGERINVRI